jgi:hypothetical protein
MYGTDVVVNNWLFFKEWILWNFGLLTKYHGEKQCSKGHLLQDTSWKTTWNTIRYDSQPTTTSLIIPFCPYWSHCSWDVFTPPLDSTIRYCCCFLQKLNHLLLDRNSNWVFQLKQLTTISISFVTGPGGDHSVDSQSEIMPLLPDNLYR